ncbi:MAG: succinate dehydrogenase assembly factor 2 [Pseudomonadota bacterium]|nr:succinate dehydrogenase assembly factor 2 [Pseudomonadota bacterium]
MCWSSRRGMLELDLLLLPFAEQVFPQLTPQHQALYVELLAQEDQQLFAWLVRGDTPVPRWQELIGQIRRFAQAPTPPR